MKPSGILMTVIMIGVMARSAQSNLQNDSRGQYYVLIKEYEDCGKENALARYEFKNQKVTMTSIIVEGRITHNFTTTDEIKLKSVMQQYKDRQWKDNYMVFDFGGRGLCTTLSTAFSPDELKKSFSKLVDQDNRTLTKYCDVPPGEYRFSGLSIDWSEFKGFPEFAYGRYRSKNTLHSPEGEIGCQFTYYDIMPMNKKKTVG